MSQINLKLKKKDGNYCYNNYNLSTYNNNRKKECVAVMY